MITFLHICSICNVLQAIGAFDGQAMLLVYSPYSALARKEGHGSIAGEQGCTHLYDRG